MTTETVRTMSLLTRFPVRPFELSSQELVIASRTLKEDSWNLSRNRKISDDLFVGVASQYMWMSTSAYKVLWAVKVNWRKSSSLTVNLIRKLRQPPSSTKRPKTFHLLDLYRRPFPIEVSQGDWHKNPKMEGQKTQPGPVENTTQHSEPKSNRNVKESEQKQRVFQAYHHIFVGDRAMLRRPKAIR